MSLAVPFSADADEQEDAIMLPVPEGDMWPLLLLASVLLLLILLLLLGSLLSVDEAGCICGICCFVAASSAIACPFSTAAVAILLLVVLMGVAELPSYLYIRGP